DLGPLVAKRVELQEPEVQRLGLLATLRLAERPAHVVDQVVKQGSAQHPPLMAPQLGLGFATQGDTPRYPRKTHLSSPWQVDPWTQVATRCAPRSRRDVEEGEIPRATP